MPTWLTVPDINFPFGIPARIPIDVYVTDYDAITLSNTLPLGIVFDGTSFIYDGNGPISIAPQRFLTAYSGGGSVMNVRRKSPICPAVQTGGTAVITYKGKQVTVKADFELTLPDGSKAVFKDLTGFNIIQQSPLLVQQIHPVEKAVQWDKHGDHPSVRPLKTTDDFHQSLVSSGKNPDSYGVMINHAGHQNEIRPGDFIIGNPGFEIRRKQEDMGLYEIV